MSAVGVNKILRQALKCKADGMCAREKILNDHLEQRFHARERALQTLDEIIRETNELPRCPPDCDNEVLVVKKS